MVRLKRLYRLDVWSSLDPKEAELVGSIRCSAATEGDLVDTMIRVMGEHPRVDSTRI